jgi:hypothetical protein
VRSNPTIHLLIILIIHILHTHLPARLSQCALTRCDQQRKKLRRLGLIIGQSSALQLARHAHVAGVRLRKRHSSARTRVCKTKHVIYAGRALPNVAGGGAWGGLYFVASKPRSRRPTSQTPRGAKKLSSRPLLRSRFPPVPVGPRSHCRRLGRQCLLSSVIDHDLSTAPELRSITLSDVPTQPHRKDERETLSSSVKGLLLVWTKRARGCST